MTLEAGQRLNHYRLVEKIGEGGMGAVWKARDTTLDRDVAIKVLPESGDPERLRRFGLEARAASALNHPNIIHIYAIGEHEGTPYIAMEYVDGTTVRDLLARGPLPNDKLLRYATQIAEGLAKAHQAGIVHRDLKPENVMVTVDDHVKILDFGLAKLLDDPAAGDRDAATATREHTMQGTVMGTASYMSPEQALGQPVDSRTDVFSLGAVLHEMATGAKPFTGNTLPALYDQILNRDAPSASSLNPILPGHLDGVIRKALAKDRAERYPSAKELLADLRAASASGSGPVVEAVPSPPPGSSKKSVLVLPFQNVSPDPEQEYFCDGMTDEIISNLSSVDSLRVISRTSSMLLKGTDKAMKAIGEELDVQYVLEGSVRKAGGNLRITAQLIDAARDVQLWSDRYAGTLDNVFDVQEEVSRSIVDALEINLSTTEKHQIAARPFDNVEVYERYHRARRHTLKLSREGLEAAVEELQAGLDVAGENVLLYAGMADVYIQQREIGVSLDDTSLEKADDIRRKILALDPDSAEAYYIAGRLERFRGTSISAAADFERALARDPNHRSALLNLSALYGLHLGRLDLAWPLMKRLLEVDPLTPLTLLCEGFLYWVEGRLDEAGRTFARAGTLQEESQQFHTMFLANVLVRQKRHAELADLTRPIFAQGETDALVDLSLFYEAIVNDGATHGSRTLSEASRAYLWTDPDLFWWVADAYALAGDSEEALRWLERSVEKGWINYPLWRDDSLLDSLRGEARFQAMMEGVRLKWERFVPFDPQSD